MVEDGKLQHGGFYLAYELPYVCFQNLIQFCLADWPKSDQSAIEIDKKISASMKAENY
jgi:hypothetical protein